VELFVLVPFTFTSSAQFPYRGYNEELICSRFGRNGVLSLLIRKTHSRSAMEESQLGGNSAKNSLSGERQLLVECQRDKYDVVR